MSIARIYGRVVGHASHVRVTAGFVHTLREASVLAGVVPLDLEGDSDAISAGALARVGILTGKLNHADRMLRNTRHEFRHAMVAPNSDQLPPALIKALDSVCTLLLTPSSWASHVVEQHSRLKVFTVPHGVDAGLRPMPELAAIMRQQYAQGQFVVRHFSTSDRERKGTIELLLAWEMLMERKALPSAARLEIVLDAEVITRIVTWYADRGIDALPAGVVIHPRWNIGSTNMSEALSSCHVVCQPSRGEAFGMIPLEALACGIPIVATKCTGHSQWYDADLVGAIEVQHGPNAPIDDLPNATAPSVSPDEIASALQAAYESWPRLEDKAKGQTQKIADHWSWRAQLEPYVKVLRMIGP